MHVPLLIFVLHCVDLCGPSREWNSPAPVRFDMLIYEHALCAVANELSSARAGVGARASLEGPTSHE